MLFTENIKKYCLFGKLDNLLACAPEQTRVLPLLFCLVNVLNVGAMFVVKIFKSYLVLKASSDSHMKQAP